MDRRSLIFLVIRPIVIVLPLISAARTPLPAKGSDEEQAIRATSKQYRTALERGDVKQLSQLWTPDGDYVDEAGQARPASDLIAQEAKTGKSTPGAEMKLTNNSIRLLTPDVALEDGVAEIPQAGRAPLRGRFTVVWVKQAGKWKLASLREAPIAQPESPNQLGQLDWMVGQWSGDNGGATVEVSAEWNPTHTFLIRELKVLSKGQPVFSATQHIGWDPRTRTIKSWVFDSRGGYGEGVWTRQGDSWVVQTTGVLANGKQTSATNLYIADGKNVITWKSTGGRTNGEPVPDLQFKLTRKSG